MRKPCFSMMAFLLALLLTSTASRAEIHIVDRSVVGEYYAHPLFRSLVFVTAETRAQAILPPAPVFVAPAPLIWRAPLSPSPPVPPVSERFATSLNTSLAAYSADRAQAMRQGLHRKKSTIVWLGPLYPEDWLCFGVSSCYSPAASRLTHPNNLDNARNLAERAHRFSQGKP